MLLILPNSLFGLKFSMPSVFLRLNVFGKFLTKWLVISENKAGRIYVLLMLKKILMNHFLKKSPSYPQVLVQGFEIWLGVAFVSGMRLVLCHPVHPNLAKL